ncbi:MAG: hypothetical protein K8R36_18250 [Planctomycetales bacterium]|nr:hypothetical protein [Planctomycetales bacterium]
MLTKFLLSAALAFCAATWFLPPLAAEEPDRFWFLIHDKAVLTELKLSAAEQVAMRKEIDALDAQFMPLRGTTPEKVAAELPGIIAEAKKRLHTVLTPEQERRLQEIVMRVQGPAALLRTDVAAQMKFTADQKKKIEKVTGDTQKAIADLEKQANEGKPREPLEKEAIRLRTDEQADVLKILTKPQQTLWRKLAGSPFDASRLGKLAFKAPEVLDTGAWINSQPLTLSQLKGKVVALHFYTFG